MTETLWWYEWNGAQAGPVPEPVLLEMVRSGRLRREARVWRAGMPAWQPAFTVPELSAAVPSPGAPPSPPPLPPAWTGGTLPPGMEAVSAGAVVGLGIVTLGIYPMVKFYQAGLAYEELAGRRSRFALYFWSSIGLAVAGGPLHLLGGVIGFGGQVAAVLLTILTLLEVLAVRTDVVRRYAIAPVVTSDRTHQILFIAGILTSWLLVGVVLLLIQAVKFFDDHRAIGDALRRRPAPAPASPRPQAPSTS